MKKPSAETGGFSCSRGENHAVMVIAWYGSRRVRSIGSYTMQDGFVITGSLIVLCKTKDGKPPKDGGQTLSFAEIDIGKPQKGLTVFTDLDLAERYITGMKIVGCYPLEFEGPEFANFLETDGKTWKHLAIDPTTQLNAIQVVVAAADLIRTIRSAEST